MSLSLDLIKLEACGNNDLNSLTILAIVDRRLEIKIPIELIQNSILRCLIIAAFFSRSVVTMKFTTVALTAVSLSRAIAEPCSKILTTSFPESNITVYIATLVAAGSNFTGETMGISAPNEGCPQVKTDNS